MEVSNAAIANQQADEIIQAMMLKKSIKAEQAQQLALIESARSSTTSQPLDGRLIGRLLNEKA